MSDPNHCLVTAAERAKQSLKHEEEVEAIIEEIVANTVSEVNAAVGKAAAEGKWDTTILEWYNRAKLNRVPTQASNRARDKVVEIIRKAGFKVTFSPGRTENNMTVSFEHLRPKS